MGGSSTTQSRQTTQTQLPGNQQRNVDVLLNAALDYFRGGGRDFFPGDTVADFDPFQIQGQNLLLDYAGGAGQSLVDSAINGNQFFLNPENILNPDNIPGFSGSVDAITRNLTDNLTRNILPSIRGGATASGQFGGSASGIGQGLAAGETSQALGDSLSNLYLGAYGQGLDSFNQAQARAPALFALGAAPGSLVSGVGGQRQQQAQNEIQGERERFEFGQNEPAILLAMLQALTGSSGQYGGTVESQSRQRTSSSPGLAQGIGGLLSLASIISTGGAAAPAVAAGGAGKGGGAAGGAAAGGGGFGSFEF